jgi:O-antigen/teichoic acid export membrane protein/glycosyltransferase involved in cell wall biosynthesis
MQDFKKRTIRGGVAKVVAQGTTFSLRLGSLMILARLLNPRDFGLVGMVMALTGVLNLFRDFGLSAATVQRVKVTAEQVSTLFWINVVVGVGLTALTMAAAPAIAAFYHEPRLLWITIVLAFGFVINAAGVQHSSLLQRQMRFTTMAAIDVLSLVISVVIAIGMARRGFGYWALVAAALIPTVVMTTCLWIASGWIPGKPQRGSGVRSLLRFGGTLTLNGIVVYIANNLDKVLIGRWWGAQAVGLYGRAYQLINIPIENLNFAAGEVAFPALSRVQDDPPRLRRYFLKGYSLVVGLTVPITIACALLANDLISVVLGPKWQEAILIFRLLSPTILILALINPLIWLVLSLGMVERSLRIGLVYSPLVILGCVAGLPYGPVGVAVGYSSVLALWCIPHIAWAVHGTVVSLKDVLHAAGRPLLAGCTGAAAALVLQLLYVDHLTALPRLILGVAILGSVYVFMLLFVLKQKDFYWELVVGMFGGAPREQGPSERMVSQSENGSTGQRNGIDVLFVAADYKPNPGGIAAYVDSLARGLIRIGQKVKILALVEPEENERFQFLSQYENWVTPFRIAHDRRPNNWLANQWVSALEIVRCANPRTRKFLNKRKHFQQSADTIARLDEVLQREQPSLVVLGHLYLSFYPLVLHLKDIGCPYGILAHDAEICFNRLKINDRVRRGMIIRGAQWIAANSRHTKKLVEAWGIPADRIVMVHPPISEQATRVSRKQELLSADAAPYRLATVSRIVKNKGIDSVLYAVKILQNKGVACRYVVVGEGPAKPAFEELSRQLGLQDCVQFTGYIAEEDKLQLLQSSDVYVMPSRVDPKEQHEGFGIAFLEAAACGIPSVGSNAGGIPDAVIDGETGILVEPDSPEQLAEALLFLHQNSNVRHAMGRAGLERARTQFSPEAVATRFHAEVLTRSARSPSTVEITPLPAASSTVGT